MTPLSNAIASRARPLGLLLVSLLSAMWLQAKEPPTTAPDGPDKNTVLIVYLSRTKNTETVARMIQAFTGGRIVSVEPETAYPEDYRQIVDQVDRENRTGYLPPLKTKVSDLEHYQTVFVGFPTWDMTLPPPMKSFLSSHNLAGKTVVPFNTNAGYGVGSGFQVVEALCPKSRVLPGFSTTGGIERDGVLFVMDGKKAESTRDQIRDWLRTIKIPTQTSPLPSNL